MIKRIGLVVLVIIILAAVIYLTALNTGEVELDLIFFSGTFGVTEILVGAFVIGTIFGMLCMTAFVFRLISERRTLRRALRMSESEVSSLRNLPLADAD